MQTEVGEPMYGGVFACGTAGPQPLVLPGERIALEQGLVRILETSSARVEPGCVHFAVCGGCQYQHAGYGAQLTFKARILEVLLDRSGVDFPGTIEVHAAEPWGYRNRIRVRLHADGNVVRPGYSRRGSNDFLPVRMCPIAEPLLVRTAESVADLAAEDDSAGSWIRSAVEAEIFCAPEPANFGEPSLAPAPRLQMQLFLRAPDPVHSRSGSFARLCEGLRERVPELAGAGASFSPDAARRLRRVWPGTSWGAAGLRYAAARRAYWVSRGAFFQVNRFLIDRLVDLVCGQTAGARAWDLYAGVGLFSRPLAERFGSVVAVEGGDVAAADLQAASRGGRGQPAFQARHQATLDFLRAEQHQRERPDLIVLDPPRAGLGEEGAAILNRIAATEIVYVSCDPVTLARDLAVLVRGGYGLASVDLVDLFPQTFHLETVVHLRLR